MQLKAIVVKTSKLKESRDFFVRQLGFSLSESSHQHFVITLQDIRLVFMVHNGETAIELYIQRAPRSGGKQGANAKSNNRLQRQLQPPGITILMID